MSYELDEIKPFSKNGSPIDYDNVQPTHRMCNNKKSNNEYPFREMIYIEECKRKIHSASSVSEW